MKRVALTASLAWLLVLGLGLHLVSVKTHALAEARAGYLDLPPLASLETRVLDVVTLGYRGLYDDVADIWLLQVLFDPRLHQETPEAIAGAVRAVTRHAPRIESLYMMSCFILGLELKRPELCEPIMLDGLRAQPESWRIPALQGFIYAYRLNEPAKAALYYGLAASRPMGPAYMKSLAAKLATNGGLDPAEMQATLDGLIAAPGGSRMAEFLRAHAAALDAGGAPAPSDSSPKH